MLKLSCWILIFDDSIINNEINHNYLNPYIVDHHINDNFIDIISLRVKEALGDL